jgi:hypothetical protein
VEIKWALEYFILHFNHSVNISGNQIFLTCVKQGTFFGARFRYVGEKEPKSRISIRFSDERDDLILLAFLHGVSKNF